MENFQLAEIPRSPDGRIDPSRWTRRPSPTPELSPTVMRTRQQIAVAIDSGAAQQNVNCRDEAL